MLKEEPKQQLFAESPITLLDIQPQSDVSDVRPDLNLLNEQRTVSNLTLTTVKRTPNA